ncbi:MAG: xylosidase, partial [Bacteroidota bacterium]
FAYNIYYGVAPDKLYNCIMVHDANEYWFKAMDSKMPYYFTIEAINENGVSPKKEIIKVE